MFPCIFFQYATNINESFLYWQKALYADAL